MSHDDRVRYFDVFQRYDTDHDGFLDAEGLMAALKRLGRTAEAAGARHLLDTYDQGSGSIDFDAFLALLNAAKTKPGRSDEARRERSP
ncbi:EF-hand domain-containing protein [Uniformispora flossi]|uniref:EF-hand domain-containing protein n=1 Tax=Uniformispora flossi TaxID=3390723 RepID=UPI003C2D7498